MKTRTKNKYRINIETIYSRIVRHFTVIFSRSDKYEICVHITIRYQKIKWHTYYYDNNVVR